MAWVMNFSGSAAKRIKDICSPPSLLFHFTPIGLLIKAQADARAVFMFP
jgi:hypothetical protein